MSKPLPSILLAGCGKLGSALLAGWLERGLAPSVVLDRHHDGLPEPHRVARSASDIPATFEPEIIVLAVKPAAADDVLKTLAPFAKNATILSVMAGRTVEGLARACGHERIVRTMPNTPSAIGQGASGLYAAPDVAAHVTRDCIALMEAVGTVVTVETEDEMAAVTGVSGSGPAYVFLLAELLEKAGIAQGLSPKAARILARATVSGSGALLAADDRDAADLRRAVTSPNGTTQAALDVLMQDKAWPSAVDAAIAAATKRAHELAS